MCQSARQQSADMGPCLRRGDGSEEARIPTDIAYSAKSSPR